jgi:hypothetical protein
MIITRRTLSKTRLLKRFLRQSVAPMVLTAALCAPIAGYAQQTTSSISGQITEANGTPATGTVVVVTHVPSGTVSNAVVDAQGRFSAPGLRVGGPYSIKIQAKGAPVQTINDVYLQLGEPYQLTLNLRPTSTAGAMGEEIVVSSTREEVKLGTQTTFSRDFIQDTPTVSRDLKDVIKQDPRVVIDQTNSFSIQIAGTSPRFNSVTVDGVKLNDDFGLNNNGYPTHHSPIPLDAVDQLAVAIAPFDVDYDGFQGGQINIVTKSGTNQFHGSAYDYYTNDTLTGDRSGSIHIAQPKTETKTRGGSFGGPIIEDKVFFFGAFDDFQTVSPTTLGIAGGGGGPVPVPGITPADLAQITSIAQQKYGYNVGTPVATTPEHDRTAIGKFDWNINDNHRATFTYQHSDTDQLIDGGSFGTGPLYVPNPALTGLTGTPALSMSSHFYDYTQEMNDYALQVFSDWSSAFSTQLELGRKTVDSNRVPLNGYSIGEINVITNNGGALIFGPDISSQSNVLSTTTDTYKLKGKYQVGEHTFSGGFERENNDYFNLFLQRSLGQFYFSSPANFAAGVASRIQYANSYTGNPNDVAAIWNYAENSFYAQDRWEFNDALVLQAGLRYETYENPQSPLANARFLNTYHFASNSTLDGRHLILPRFGFNYKVDNQTTVRGGFGEFSTLGPVVWASNDYSNNGFTQRSLTITPTSAVGSGLLVLNNGLNVPIGAQALLANNPNAGFVNALDPKFAIPSSWRTDFAIDHQYENGLQLVSELLYSRVENGILYKDLQMSYLKAAPDGRPIYNFNASGQDLLLTNTHKGESLVVSLGANQEWKTSIGDIKVAGGYAWTQATDVNPGTSSVASSNFKTLAVSDPNNPAVATSNYEAEHSFSASVTWTEKFWDDNKTSVTLLGTARSGLPYSVVFTCGTNPFGDSSCPGTSRELLYVPNGAGDTRVDWADSKVTPAQFDAFIQRYNLTKYRGSIAPRNALNSPWFNALDLHVLQELPTYFEGHKLQFTIDTSNLSNLLFPSWGRLQQINFPGTVPVTGVSINPKTNQFIFTSSSLTTPNAILQNVPSVWSVQIGLRYSF